VTFQTIEKHGQFERSNMKTLLVLAVMVIVCFAVAQSTDQNPPDKKGDVTVTGCVDRQGGDYVLMKTNPGNTYELQPTGHIKLSAYMGKRVEVRGMKSATLATSSDEGDRMGAPSPVTITVKSIKTLADECTTH
jgi:hypothetical protein